MTADRRHDERPGRPEDDWLFVTLRDMREQETRHASEVRTALDRLNETLTAHFKEDAVVAEQVKQLAARLNTMSDTKRHLATVVISSGLVALYEGVKAFGAHFLGWK